MLCPLLFLDVFLLKIYFKGFNFKKPVLESVSLFYYYKPLYQNSLTFK